MTNETGEPGPRPNGTESPPPVTAGGGQVGDGRIVLDEYIYAGPIQGGYAVGMKLPAGLNVASLSVPPTGDSLSVGGLANTSGDVGSGITDTADAAGITDAADAGGDPAAGDAVGSNEDAAGKPGPISIAPINGGYAIGPKLNVGVNATSPDWLPDSAFTTDATGDAGTKPPGSGIEGTPRPSGAIHLEALLGIGDAVIQGTVTTGVDAAAQGRVLQPQGLRSDLFDLRGAWIADLDPSEILIFFPAEVNGDRVVVQLPGHLLDGEIALTVGAWEENAAGERIWEGTGSPHNQLEDGPEIDLFQESMESRAQWVHEFGYYGTSRSEGGDRSAFWPEPTAIAPVNEPSGTASGRPAPELGEAMMADVSDNVVALGANDGPAEASDDQAGSTDVDAEQPLDRSATAAGPVEFQTWDPSDTSTPEHYAATTTANSFFSGRYLAIGIIASVVVGALLAILLLSGDGSEGDQFPAATGDGAAASGSPAVAAGNAAAGSADQPAGGATTAAATADVEASPVATIAPAIGDGCGGVGAGSYTLLPATSQFVFGATPINNHVSFATVEGGLNFCLQIPEDVNHQGVIDGGGFFQTTLSMTLDDLLVELSLSAGDGVPPFIRVIERVGAIEVARFPLTDVQLVDGVVIFFVPAERAGNELVFDLGGTLCGDLSFIGLGAGTFSGEDSDGDGVPDQIWIGTAAGDVAAFDALVVWP